MVGTAYEGAARDLVESHVKRRFPPLIELFRCNEFLNGQMFRRGLKILADGQHPAAGVEQIMERLTYFVRCFTQSEHNR